MKKLLKKINFRVFIISITIWLILFLTGIQDKYFDTKNLSKFRAIVGIFSKILNIIFIYFIVYKFYRFWINRKNQKTKCEFLIFVVYFFISMIILLIVWPGTWSWDDIYILHDASKYSLSAWQHFFSGLFYILCLQILPFATGVIIIQSLLISLIVGYCVSNISSIFSNSKKQYIILSSCLTLILLLPPSIAYAMSGFRMGLYQYLELLLIVKVIILYKNQEKIDIVEIIKLFFLLTIVGSWRTEAIYYPFVFFIILLFLGKNKIKRLTAFFMCLISLITILYIGKFNTYLIGNNKYSITATMRPVVSLVRISDESDSKEIEAIGKVLDIEIIKEHPSQSPESLFWDTNMVKVFTDQEYKNYIKAYIKLALKYPDTVLSDLWGLFYQSTSGHYYKNHLTMRNNVDSFGIYSSDNYRYTIWNMVPSFGKNPINKTFREHFIKFLCGFNDKMEINIIYKIFWNLFIPLTLVLICLIYKLVKKNWFFVFLILLVLCRVPLVFLTACAPYFMYYLSTYICCYFISVLVIFEFVVNFNKNRKDETLKEIEYKGNDDK